MNIKFKHSCL